MKLANALLFGTLSLVFTAPLLAAGTTSPAPTTRPPQATGQELAYFEAKVRPLLVERCSACHSAKTTQGDLRLDTPDAMRKGGESGPLMVPGKPDESRLIDAIRYGNPHLQMPPSGKLPQAEIDILTTWVQRGAALPAPTAAGAKPGGRRALGLEEGKRFWSIRPFIRTSPPAVKQPKWVARRIDQYLLASLEKASLTPAPRADAATLIRRVTFDLTGLPPTPEEIDAFVRECEEEKASRKDAETQRDKKRDKDGKRDGSENVAASTAQLPTPDSAATQRVPGAPGLAPSSAYSRLIDRLLASPAYGERWARHWLDLVRYCDVLESWAQTDAQPWLYRDWVVKAINDDLPYDRFVRLQLAADELPGTAPADYAALGFIGLSPSYWKELKLSPDVIKTVVAEEWEERINTVSGTLLGLTVACARCHDHKFDPISQKDYYALAGIFASTRLVSRPLLATDEARTVLTLRARISAQEAEMKRMKEAAAKEVAKAPELLRQVEVLQSQVAELKRSHPHLNAPTAYAVETASLEVLPDGPDRTQLTYRDGKAQDVPMQLRGNPAKPGSVVPRQFLGVFSTSQPARFEHGSGRGDFAEAVFREAAPLTARVMVNRVWKQHFGRGLVETPSNFGTQGDRRTHPELLDDLASRFIQNGWSLKWLHREILLSSAYQQSGRTTAAGMAKDPDNRLLGRMTRRRLEVEPWRDALLSAAGVLDTRLGGAAQELGDPKNVRRTLYGTITRRELNDLLRLYDFPDPTGHSPARFHTTTPLQQLYVLNSDFISRQAANLNARLEKEVPGSRDGQIQRAHQLLYGRKPTPHELTAARTFLAPEGSKQPEAALWTQYLEVLLARNELMFVD